MKRKKGNVSVIGEMYKIEEIIESVVSFRDLAVDLKEILNICGTTINESDKAIGDIRHYCELRYPKTVKERANVCKLMHDLGVERRTAKNLVMTLASLDKLLSCNRNFVSELGKVANDLARYKRCMGREQIYKPRVLTELFEDKVEEVPEDTYEVFDDALEQEPEEAVRDTEVVTETNPEPEPEPEVAVTQILEMPKKVEAPASVAELNARAMANAMGADPSEVSTVMAMAAGISDKTVLMMEAQSMPIKVAKRKRAVKATKAERLKLVSQFIDAEGRVLEL